MVWIVVLIALYLIMSLTILGVTVYLDGMIYNELEWFIWPWVWPLMPIRLAIYVLQLRRKNRR